MDLVHRLNRSSVLRALLAFMLAAALMLPAPAVARAAETEAPPSAAGEGTPLTRSRPRPSWTPSSRRNRRNPGT